MSVAVRNQADLLVSTKERLRFLVPPSGEAIGRFDGVFAWLSNFWPGPLPTVEHLFQACKTLDQEQRRLILQAPTPGQAKRLGRGVALRPDWEAVKVDMMWELVAWKFENPSLRQRLLDTGLRPLVEGNTWGDRIWGICGGSGQNLLGLILMKVREDVRLGTSSGPASYELRP